MNKTKLLIWIVFCAIIGLPFAHARRSGGRFVRSGGGKRWGSWHGRRRWGGGFGIGFGSGWGRRRWRDPWYYGPSLAVDLTPDYYDDYYVTEPVSITDYRDSRQQLSWHVQNYTPYPLRFQAENGGDIQRIEPNDWNMVKRGNSFRFNIRAGNLPIDQGFVQGSSNHHKIIVQMTGNKLRVITKP